MHDQFHELLCVQGIIHDIFRAYGQFHSQGRDVTSEDLGCCTGLSWQQRAGRARPWRPTGNGRDLGQTGPHFARKEGVPDRVDQEHVEEDKVLGGSDRKSMENLDRRDAEQPREPPKTVVDRLNMALRDSKWGWDSSTFSVLTRGAGESGPMMGNQPSVAAKFQHGRDNLDPKMAEAHFDHRNCASCTSMDVHCQGQPCEDHLKPVRENL